MKRSQRAYDDLTGYERSVRVSPAGMDAETHRAKVSTLAKAEFLAMRKFKTETRVLYAVAVGLAFISGALYSHQQDLARQQKEGRKVAINVTCAAIGAIGEAGRSVILGTPARQTETENAARKLFAAQYVKSIATNVEMRSGVKGIVLKDGSLDCLKLQAKAKAR